MNFLAQRLYSGQQGAMTAMTEIYCSNSPTESIAPSKPLIECKGINADNSKDFTDSGIETFAYFWLPTDLLEKNCSLRIL